MSTSSDSGRYSGVGTLISMAALLLLARSAGASGLITPAAQTKADTTPRLCAPQAVNLAPTIFAATLEQSAAPRRPPISPDCLAPIADDPFQPVQAAVKKPPMPSLALSAVPCAVPTLSLEGSRHQSDSSYEPALQQPELNTAAISGPSIHEALDEDDGKIRIEVYDLSSQQSRTAEYDDSEPTAVEAPPTVAAAPVAVATPISAYVPAQEMDVFLVQKPINPHSLRNLNRGFGGLVPVAQGPHPILQNTIAGAAVYSDFPGLVPLDITMGGEIDSHQFQSHIEPLDLLSSSSLSRNSLVVNDGGSGFDLGSSDLTVPDVASGLRFFRPTSAGHGVEGVGIYQRLGSTGMNLVPGVDTEINENKNESTDFALAADSSVRLTQQDESKGWTSQLFAGWNAANKQQLGNAYVAKQFGDTSLFQNVTLSSGSDDGYTWSQGLNKKIGQANLLMATSLTRLNGSSQTRSGIGIFSPIGRNLFSVRWDDESNAQTGDSQHLSQLFSTYVCPLRNGNLIVLSDNLLNESGTHQENESNISNSWQMGKIWSMQLGVSRFWETGQDRLNAAIGFWATPQWQARLLFGPSEGVLPDQSHSSVFGFQLVNRFNLATYSTGTVSGSVLIDGLPATEPIEMMMEDRTTVTDRHGKFKFDHALAGSHDVGFDMANLPATLDPVNKDQTIVVQQGKTANVLFSAYRIGSVTGTIGVGADAFGKVDPTAGIGIVITDERGNETTSGINQSFLLGGEPLGKHYISIVASSLPPGYSVSGDQTQQVTVIAGTTTPVLAFQIVPKIQPVQMNDLSQ